VKPSVRRSSSGRRPEDVARVRTFSEPTKLIERDPDNGQCFPGVLPLSNPHPHAFGAMGRADSERGLN
jgi:hypothetical protein